MLRAEFPELPAVAVRDPDGVIGIGQGGAIEILEQSGVAVRS